jgi:hypothetical protein
MSIIVGFVVAALIGVCAYLNVQLGKARLETAEWRRLAIAARNRELNAAWASPPVRPITADEIAKAKETIEATKPGAKP